jgi:hypothetical protein
MRLIPKLGLLLVAITTFGSARADDNPASLAPGGLLTGRTRSTSAVDGAVVCRSLAMVAFVTVQMQSGTAPSLTSVGCAFLPSGTPVTIEKQGQALIVRGQTMLGVAVQGVSDAAMIEIDNPK